MKAFYEPTAEHVAKLSGDWCASFSGGKDSTALVTWVEWLRRTGAIAPAKPRLVQADTLVEDPALGAVGSDATALLSRCGWECGLVVPEVHERLYPQILGRGLPPIHPGVRRMRWCTRSTKIDPMNRWKGGAGGPLWITGLRLGESAMRDAKILKKSSCAAGGECGIPDPGEGRYSPLLRWTTCQVVDWLNGAVSGEVARLMGDVFAVTRKLSEVYGFRPGQPVFEGMGEPEVEAARFGCVGCPAIGEGPAAPLSVVRRYGGGHPLNELYGVWFEARKAANRLVGFRRGKPIMGPIRMEARKRLFGMVTDIQTRAGVVLVGPEDEAFIRECWAKKVYPRGWSEADEATVLPPDAPLFDGVRP